MSQHQSQAMFQQFILSFQSAPHGLICDEDRDRAVQAWKTNETLWVQHEACSKHIRRLLAQHADSVINKIGVDALYDVKP